MKKNEGKVVAILGTIIIHLIGAILFMSLKLTSINHEKQSEFLIEFEPDRDYSDKQEVEKPVTLRELFADDDRYRDIVRNIANQPDVEIDPQEYIDRVKDEMIASGQLSKDNFIDEQKNQVEEMKGGETAVELNNKEENKDEEKENITANEMAANYQGPTHVFYDLSNRYKIELPIPIYKCEGSGKVVVKIEVNQDGDITWSKIDQDNSTNDQCLIEAALSAVKRTTFNPDTNAEPKQPGTITYLFVAQ